MTILAQAFQQALRRKWSLAWAGAEDWAKRVLGSSANQQRTSDYLRGFQDGYWRGAEDTARINPEDAISHLTH